MKPMTPVDLTFLDSAPLRLQVSHHLRASPERVFAALAPPASWLEWFPLMRAAEWLPGPVECVGARRRVRLTVFGGFDEVFLAWEVPAGGNPGRYTFAMTASTSPLASAMAEDYRVLADGSGTRIDWTLAATLTPLGKVGRPALVGVMRGLFGRALRNLDAHLDPRT